MDRAHAITILITIITALSGAGWEIGNSIASASAWKQRADDYRALEKQELDRMNAHMRNEDKIQAQQNNIQQQQADAISKIQSDIEWLKKNSPNARFAPEREIKPISRTVNPMDVASESVAPVHARIPYLNH